MRNPRHSWWRRGGALACLLALGCVSVPSASAPETVDDPSAERLHRLCEYIALYYAAQHELPPNARVLKETFGADLPPCESPRSGSSYSFLSGTVAIPGRPGRLFMLDPTPTMLGGRRCMWAVLVSESPQRSNLVTQVVPLAEREVADALSPR